MRASRLIPWLFALGLPWLGAGDAVAKSEFVDLVSTHLMLPYEPPCRLCHIQGTTGPGTIVTPFGLSMRARGLTSDGSSVGVALDQLEADRADSDGDGIPDLDELRADRDPNTAADVPLGPGGPTYGCALLAPARESWLDGTACVALAAILLLGRKSSAKRERA